MVKLMAKVFSMTNRTALSTTENGSMTNKKAKEKKLGMLEKVNTLATSPRERRPEKVNIPRMETCMKVISLMASSKEKENTTSWTQEKPTREISIIIR